MAKKTSQSKLFNIIAQFGTNPRGFALLLGAGSSVAAGVKSGTEMIAEWRDKHYQCFGEPQETKEEHLRRQAWYQKQNEYGKLFEVLFDLPAQRREYIESCLKGASPSWGHTYLANMLTHGYFDTIFTTNFDDLLSDVCYKFPSVPKPVVCAHDSRIDSIRLLTSRPKIIKLHGDFLFDDMKNTPHETSDFGQNMRDKLRECAREYGLIVIGYAGRDVSVMGAIQEMIRDERTFRNGIYWCVRDPENISEKVQELSEDPRFHLVQIEGFDEFMAELNAHLNLGLPRELSAPYEALSESLQQLLTEAERAGERDLHHVIKRDRKEVKKALQRIPAQVVPETLDLEKISAFEFKIGKVTVRQPIPFGPIGEMHEEAGNTEEALRFLTLQIKHGPNPRAFAYVFELLKKHKLVDEKYDAFEEMLKASSRMFEQEYATANDLALVLMQLTKWKDAKWVLEKGEVAFKKSGDTNPVLKANISLNKMQIKAHTGRNLNEKDLDELNKIAELDSPYAKMGTAILQHRWEDAEHFLERCLALGPVGRFQINDWPIIGLLRPHLQSERVKERLKKAR